VVPKPYSVYLNPTTSFLKPKPYFWDYQWCLYLNPSTYFLKPKPQESYFKRRNPKP